MMEAKQKISADAIQFNRGIFGLTGWKKFLFLFVCWTALGLFEAARLYFDANVGTQVYTWTQTISWGLSDWYLWWALSYFIIRLTRKYGFADRMWPRNLAIHLAVAVVMSLIEIFLDAVAIWVLDLLFYHQMPAGFAFSSLYVLFLRQMFHTAVLIYLLIAFVAAATSYYKQYRNEELRLASARTALVQAQLEALKSKLQPHFLFNTLNSISALVRDNPDAADRMIARLSELLRIALDNEGRQTLPLRQEIDFLKRYLEIQQIRFEERLTTEFNIDSEALDALVPNLILQPLVENAIKHGISNQKAGGRISVMARRKSGQLLLEISDDGPGMADPSEMDSSSGLGLRNTRERLLQLYADRQSLEFSNPSGRGMTVTIAIPYEIGVA